MLILYILFMALAHAIFITLAILLITLAIYYIYEGVQRIRYDNRRRKNINKKYYRNNSKTESQINSKGK